MILVRTTFQVKFGHMDAVLGIIKEATESGINSAGVSRVLTDASGDMFTLVFESEFESIDAHRTRLENSYGEAEAQAFMGRIAQHIDSGRTDYFNIELEA